MKCMEWKPNFNLNIKSIDQQHQKLVEIINLLYDSSHPSTHKDELHTLVEILNKKPLP